MPAGAHWVYELRHLRGRRQTLRPALLRSSARVSLPDQGHASRPLVPPAAVAQPLAAHGRGEKRLKSVVPFQLEKLWSFFSSRAHAAAAFSCLSPPPHPYCRSPNLLEVVKRGFDVLHSDADAVWIGDPSAILNLQVCISSLATTRHPPVCILRS